MKMTKEILVAFKEIYAKYGTNKTFSTLAIDMNMATFYKYKKELCIETVDVIHDRELTLGEVLEMLNEDESIKSTKIEYIEKDGTIYERSHEIRYKFTKELQDNAPQQTQTERKQMYRVIGIMTGETVGTFESEAEAAEFCKAWIDDFHYDLWMIEMV